MAKEAAGSAAAWATVAAGAGSAAGSAEVKAEPDNQEQSWWRRGLRQQSRCRLQTFPSIACFHL